LLRLVELTAQDQTLETLGAPGHWEQVKMAAGLAQPGALTPLNDNERKVIEAIAEKSDPIFPKHA
jgi:hypothetical protein